MNEDRDWIDEGKCEAPADHDEALRAMTEMRESIRNLVHWAQLQNRKLRSTEILSDVEGELENESDKKPEQETPIPEGD